MKNKNQSSFYTSLLLCITEGLVVGLLASLGMALLIVLFSGTAQAENLQEYDTVMTEDLQVIRNSKDIQPGSLLFRNSGQLHLAPLLHTDVSMQISGMLSRVTVRQKFSNITREWQEGIYAFPLPDDAAVDTLKMQIGERIIEGEIQEKQQARKKYEAARLSGKKASLVEQERPNIFTTSVANIAPSEIITIEIQYQHVVHYDSGEFSLRFPLVVAPRYIPGEVIIQGFDGNGWATNTDQVPDAARITPHVLHPDKGKINPVSITVDLDAGFSLQNITSPYHAINIDQRNPNHYRVSLVNTDIPADRDFVLSWLPEPAAVPRAALFNERQDNKHYALVMLLPPEQNKKTSMNREVIYVIDTSGSMGGTSIRQARQALLYALDRLQSGDRFNIIQFNNRTRQLFQLSQPVNHQSLRQARSYVSKLKAGGGTEMAPALSMALSDHTETSLVRQIIFITDGSIGNESGLFHLINTRLGKSRLFTVGIGSAPNSYFMRKAAEIGRGTFTYIGQVSDVESQMQGLFRKIESPVLTELNLQQRNLSLEAWPEKIPDLYHGEPLLIAIKSGSHTTALPLTLTLTGRISEKPWQSTLPLSGGKSNHGVARLWARKKIESLMDRWHLVENRDAIRDEITNTALNHHLVSKFTSLVAIDKTPARIKEELKTRPLPVNLPAGWQYEKVFGQLPATATPAMLHILFGMLLMLLSFICNFIYRPLRNE